MTSYKIENEWNMYVLLLKIVCFLKKKLDKFSRIPIPIYRVNNKSLLNGYIKYH